MDHSMLLQAFNFVAEKTPISPKLETSRNVVNILCQMQVCQIKQLTCLCILGPLRLTRL